MINFKQVSTLLIALALGTVSCQIEEVEKGSLVPLTVEDDPTLPFIEINGTKLHAETYGNPNDPIIIVLHGGPGADYRYMLNCKQFADDGYFVVFFDQRGAGLSERHDAKVYEGDTYLEDLRQIIGLYRQSPNQKVILMGHSWGAMYATWYVNTYPNDIDGLILAEPGGFTDEQVTDYITKAFAIDPFSEWTNDVTWKDQMLTGEDHEMKDYSYMLTIVGNKGTGDKADTPKWRMGYVCNEGLISSHPNYDWTTNLENYTTKVLFMYSELNPAYGKAHAQELATSYPYVEVHEIMGTGHEITYFAFDQFYALSSAYLNEILN